MTLERLDGCHVFFVAPTDSVATALFEERERLLSPEELERSKLLLLKRRAREYAVAWAMTRCALSRFADVRAEEWRFAYQRLGKPELGPPYDALGLQFNASHCSEIIACAITQRAPVGIDVESCAERVSFDPLAIADGRFTQREADDIRRAAPTRRLERFFRYWTLKEALLKALGDGLNMPLNTCSFDPDTTPIRADFTPASALSGSEWQFHQQLLGPGGIMALAINSEQSVRVVVRQFEFAFIPVSS